MSNSGPAAQESPALKGAKIAVIILSSLIILALIALVAGAAMKMSQKRRAPNQASDAAAAAQSLFMLPMGARLVEMQTQPGRLILHLRTLEGEEIDIVDTADGHLVSRIKAVQ